jgi:hypothetical protein
LLLQVFVTASPALRAQVAAAFQRLQSAVLSPAEAAVAAAAAAVDYHTFACIPDEAFPLFLSNKQYLRLLDGTVGQPFFKQRDPETGAVLEGGGEGERDFLEGGLVDLTDLSTAAAGGEGQQLRPSNHVSVVGKVRNVVLAALGGAGELL